MMEKPKSLEEAVKSAVRWIKGDASVESADNSVILEISLGNCACPEQASTSSFDNMSSRGNLTHDMDTETLLKPTPEMTDNTVENVLASVGTSHCNGPKEIPWCCCGDSRRGGVGWKKS